MPNNPKKLLARINARLRQSRPGSVLIIVIVLLLLLAILGAAYISTTRSSRVASAQNVLSSDVDSTLNGIAEVCQGVITDDLNDTFGNLHGNTAYIINPAPANPIINRSFYQGGTGTYPGQLGSVPPVAPNAPVVVNPVTTLPGWSYNPGDIVNDAANSFIFYALQGTTSVSSNNDITPSATPGTGWQIMNGHLPITAGGSDPWLADRIPDPAGTAVPLWLNLTQSIQVTTTYPGGAPASILGTPFEDPTRASTDITSSLMMPLVGGSPTSQKPLYPTYLKLSNGYDIPALTYTNPPANTVLNTFAAADADGDGIADSFLFRIPGMSLDGLTWFAGVRIIDNNSAINANTAWSRDNEYIYGAGGPTAIPNAWSLFQTSVGLQEIINSGDSINTVNAYRFNSPAVTANQDPFDESAIGSNVPPQALDRGLPVSASTPNHLQDYNFISEGEAFYQQFIRRMANPGYNTYTGGTPPTGLRYQAIPLSDEAELAYHFGLLNSASAAPQTVLESLLPASLYWKTPPAGPIAGTAYNSVPYDPSQTNTPTTGWFASNFAYPAPSATDNLTLPMRALLVVKNPVSNYIQQVYNNNSVANGGAGPDSGDPILPNYMLPYSSPKTLASPNNPHFKGIWSNSVAYNLNDIVVFPGPNPPVNVTTGVAPGAPYNGPSYTFIVTSPTGLALGQPPPATFNSNNVMTTPTAAQLANWQLQPWSTNPTKANVNTATLRELFRAFWCVMAGNPSNATPFGSTGVDAYNIYDPTPPTTASPPTGNPQVIFRSPLRDPVGEGTANVSLLDVPAASAVTPPASVTNTNVMLLRAALAAINAIGLRDNSQNIISRTIDLLNPSQIDNGAGGTTAAPVELQVYSSAPQPVISEVHVNTFTGNDINSGLPNPQGYVAIELYNPYPVTLTLVNWQLGLINRTATGSAAFANLYPNLSFQTNPPGTISASPPPPPPTPSVSVIGPTTGQMQALNDPTAPGPPTPLPPGVIKIPAHGYALLENYNGSLAAPANPTYDAACRSASAVMPYVGGPPTTGSFTTAAGVSMSQGIWTGPNPAPNTCDVYVQNLQLVIGGTIGGSITGTSTGGELVLLRPRQANGSYTASTDPQNTFNEGTFTSATNATYPTLYSQVNPNLNDLVPVDSYDFSGVTIGTTSLGTAWSYVRMKGTSPATWFKQIFPGFYSVTTAVVGLPREAAAPAPGGGTATQVITPALQNWQGVATPTISAVPTFGFDATLASYSNIFPPIQIYNITLGNAADWMHFPNSVVSPQNPYPTGIVPAAGQTALHPHGGFARNGDMLDVPFIGAYRIRQISTIGTNPQFFLELNSLPKDSSIAAVATGVPAVDAVICPAQNIGRFVPMSASFAYLSALQTLRSGGAIAGVTLPLPDYYSWTRNLFNYLTVQSSTDTYLPNVDPNIALSSPAAPTFAYPPQNAATPIPPTPVLTANATASDQTAQDNVGVEGLININTASWKVLSMLPFVPSSVAGAPKINQQIAQNIVAYRVINGPFTSIFDLNQVPGFQNGTGAAAPSVAPLATFPTSANGLLSPADPKFETTTPLATATGIQEDYQWDCLTLNRISNLITTRSDTFTIYVVLQGWQNVGTANAQPMVTRRFAYIVDRSAINSDPSTRYLKTLTVPND
jgi:Helix-hairpin-helix motif